MWCWIKMRNLAWGGARSAQVRSGHDERAEKDRGADGAELERQRARLEGVRERARKQGGPEGERLEKQAEARLRDIDRRIEALRASLG